MCDNSLYLHIGKNGFTVRVYIIAFQPEQNTPEAVGLLALSLAIRNQISLPSILGRSALPFTTCVVPATGNIKYFTHCIDWMFFTKMFNISIFLRHLLPTSNKKFRGSSAYIRRFVISLFFLISGLISPFFSRPFGCGIYLAAKSRSFRF